MKVRCSAFAIAYGVCFPCAMYAQSAIGQLESLTGQRLNRPVINGTAPTGFGNASSALSAFSMGLQLMSMLDTGGSSSQSDSAKVAMEQEHMRLLQEQRLQSKRLITASRLRDFWDRQEMQSSETLGEILSAPVGGTAFFGSGGNPSSVPGEVSVQARSPDVFPPPLLPPSPSPQPVPLPPVQPVQPSFTATAPVAPRGGTMDKVQERILGGKPWAKEYLGDVGKGLVKRLAETLPARWNAPLILDHQEKMTDFVDCVFTALEPKRLVATLVNGDSADVAAILNDLDKVERRALGLGIGDNPLEAEEMDTLARWLHGERPEAKKIMGHLFDRTRSFVIERQVDVLLGGGF